MHFSPFLCVCDNPHKNIYIPNQKHTVSTKNHQYLQIECDE